SVRFKHVDFSYANDGQRLALKDINLTIAAGQTVGILGGTGSGKTSLVSLIPRLYDATAGKVLVGGVDVRDYDLSCLRREVAMVLQKNVLFSGTIAQTLRWGNPHATLKELEQACKQAQIHDFIKSLPRGYQTQVEQGGTNFSGGQKQRLCIARAVLAKPKVLILDDSTSAVDTKTESLIRQAWQKQIPGTTIIVIAQRVLSVKDADQIVVMDRGKIVGVGTHKQLLKNNQIYQEVYQSQIQEQA
ncbi:ATP-binding cassette domain-containing protein, partial [bacterium]|nr:ATP-binding cassette domain-containing protein [bacterium]